MLRAHHLSRILAGTVENVVQDETGTARSYAEIDHTAARIAEDLRMAGLMPDQPVHVLIANRVLDLAALFGVWKAGGVAVPLHSNAAETTRSAVRTQTRARLQVADGAVSLIAETPPPPRPLLNGAALIIFTSGTTGKPKGVVLGHDRFAAKLGVLQNLLGLTAHDTILLPLQLVFVFGLWVALLTLKTGARLELVGKFSPVALRARLHEATVLAAVPSMLRAVFAHGTVHAPHLRTIMTGGEALGAHLSSEMRRVLPHAGIYDLYGLTETGSCDFCLRPEEADAGMNTIGRPTEQIAYRIHVAEGEESVLGVAEGAPSGELLIRSPFGMLGYLDNPELTKASFIDGYFRTGDLVRERADGRVEIVGRIKEMISRGGNKIAPAEIEALLSTHPAIAQVLCAGVPDSRLGEALHAAVVLKAGATVEAEALRDWCRDKIERFKIPDKIHILDALPTGPTGKASRAGLKAIAEQNLGHH
jgi:long-chain acyl-CoA synthetase